MYKDSTGKYTTKFKNITQNTYNGIMCTNLEHGEFPDDEFIDKYSSVLLQSGYLLTIINIFRRAWLAWCSFDRDRSKYVCSNMPTYNGSLDFIELFRSFKLW